MTPRAQESVIGGLSHLVEAATALSQLVDATKTQPIEPKPSLQQPETNQSVVSDEDEEKRKQTIPSIPAAPTPQTTTPRCSREIFPQRLMAILADSTLTDIISWLPHGRSFVIIRPDVFSEQVLPKYFPSTDSRSSTKYPSFTRKLNRWGFRQATRGPDTGAFHHPLFRRDQPTLCLDMVCQKSRKRSTKKRQQLEDDNSHNSNNDNLKKVVDEIKPMPPKKRKVDEIVPISPVTPPTATTMLTSESLSTLPSVATHSASPSTVSLDDRSVSSGTTPEPMQNQTFVAGQPLSPWVPNDPALVAATLKTREEIEKITVAKSMLYDAYLKALSGQ